MYIILCILKDKYSQNPKELIRIIKKCLETESVMAQQNNVCIVHIYIILNK